MMKRERVFEAIKLSEKLSDFYSHIGNGKKTIGQWTRFIQRELKQNSFFSRPLNALFKKKDITVRYVIGDVLCIRTNSTSDTEEMTMMYINIASLDCLIGRMRENSGHEFKIFLDAIKKNYYDIYGASILILGFLQRDKKKNMYDARTAWKKLLKEFPNERNECLNRFNSDISDSPEKKILLSWHKGYSAEATSRKDL